MGGEGTFGVTFTWCFDWGLLFMILMGHWGILSVFTYFLLIVVVKRERNLYLRACETSIDRLRRKLARTRACMENKLKSYLTEFIHTSESVLSFANRIELELELLVSHFRLGMKTILREPTRQ